MDSIVTYQLWEIEGNGLARLVELTEDVKYAAEWVNEKENRYVDKFD